MAIGVNFQKQKSGGSNALFQLAGMGAGALVGGPAGAAAGGSIGGMVGGMANKPQEQAQPIEANALQRRQAQIAETPDMQINNSLAALKDIPDPAERLAMAQPLLQAQKIARNYGV